MDIIESGFTLHFSESYFLLQTSQAANEERARSAGWQCARLLETKQHNAVGMTHNSRHHTVILLSTGACRDASHKCALYPQQPASVEECAYFNISFLSCTCRSPDNLNLLLLPERRAWRLRGLEHLGLQPHQLTSINTTHRPQLTALPTSTSGDLPQRPQVWVGYFRQIQPERRSCRVCQFRKSLPRGPGLESSQQCQAIFAALLGTWGWLQQAIIA